MLPPTLAHNDSTALGAPLRLTVVLDGLELTFATDAEPSNGTLRDLAATVAAIVGLDLGEALAAVVAAYAQATTTPARRTVLARRRAAA